ncbi:MAG: dihydropteroate synthase [Mangrovibacterium sp.]
MLISSSANRLLKEKSTIVLNGKLIDLATPKIMGILNVGANSFYDGGEYLNADAIAKRVHQMHAEGVDIIDIGAVSTRPGADQPSPKEELKCLIPAVKIVRELYPEIPISIDTYRSWVVHRVVDEIGAVIVNDISGGRFDEQMFSTVAKLQVPYILMHLAGKDNGNIHETPQYTDIIKEVTKFFSDRVRKLHALGVKDVILDPGFGFGKTIDNNYTLLNSLDAFKVFQLPILAGMSRKSMFYKLMESTPDECLPATISANTLALLSGANILRVHDVKETKQCIAIFNKLKDLAE